MEVDGCTIEEISKAVDGYFLFYILFYFIFLIFYGKNPKISEKIFLNI